VKANLIDRFEYDLRSILIRKRKLNRSRKNSYSILILSYISAPHFFYFAILFRRYSTKFPQFDEKLISTFLKRARAFSPFIFSDNLVS
jgi:hypothetical protein